MKSPVPDMGANTSNVFAGKSALDANQKIYGESAALFATIIRKYLSPDFPYTIADIGSWRGELLEDVLERLQDFDWKTFAVDLNTEALEQNQSAQKTFVANADALPFADHSIDVALLRYVLQWNSVATQQKILQELGRVIKTIAIVEHAGADPTNPHAWRQNVDRLFTGHEVPKMKRANHFFSSRDEVEQWMTEAGLRWERLQDRAVPNLADAYIERFDLNEAEAETTRQILGDKNYLCQTDWIIFPHA